MDKKKNIICTILFGIILFSLLIVTMLIKNEEYGFTLFEIISPTICGFWVIECIEKFYNWLKK